MPQIFLFILLCWITLSGCPSESSADQNQQPALAKYQNSSTLTTRGGVVPSDAIDLLQKAVALQITGDTDPEIILRQKEELYKKAIEIYPDYFKAWNNLGDVYENLGDFPKSLEAYEKAQALNPDNPYPLFGKGDLYFRSGKYEKAVELYKQSLESARKFKSDAQELADFNVRESEVDEDIHITEQRLKSAQSMVEQADNDNIIPSDAILASLDLKNNEGEPIVVRGPVQGAHVLPFIPFPEKVLPFAYNSDALSRQAKMQLDELGKALNKESLSNGHFEIAGHTDARGSAKYNLDLSRRRAQSVVRYLEKECKWKVASGHLHPIGYGEQQLVIPGAKSEEEHAINRRVEVRKVDRNFPSKELAESQLRDIPAERPTENILEFGVFQIDKSGKCHLVKDDQTSLKSGDLYQVYVKPISNCYVYIYQVDSTGMGWWLFPGNKELSHEIITMGVKIAKPAPLAGGEDSKIEEISGLKNPLKANVNYWIPTREKCFQLDNTTGWEKVYLVASSHPLKNFDGISGSKDKSAKEIVKEIKVRGLAGVKAIPEKSIDNNPLNEIVGGDELWMEIKFKHE